MREFRTYYALVSDLIIIWRYTERINFWKLSCIWYATELAELDDIDDGINALGLARDSCSELCAEKAFGLDVHKIQKIFTG